MRSKTWRLLLLVLALASGGAFAHRLTVSPTAPTAGEELLLSLELVFPSVTTVQSVETRIDAQQITVTAIIVVTDFSAVTTAHVPVATRGLEAGSYEVIFQTRQTINGGFVFSQPELLGRTFVQPGAAATPLYTGLNGNYFDTGSPGWGANIVQGASRALFVGWFDYEARHSSEPTIAEAQDNTWRVLSSGKWISPTVFRGVLYTTQGTPVNRAWVPGSLQVTPAGYLTLTFASAGEALFEGDSVATRAPAAPEPFQRRATVRRFGF